MFYFIALACEFPFLSSIVNICIPFYECVFSSVRIYTDNIYKVYLLLLSSDQLFIVNVLYSNVYNGNIYHISISLRQQKPREEDEKKQTCMRIDI